MTVRVPISVTFHRLPSHLKVSPIFTSVRCIQFYVPSTIALIASSILASPSCSRATSARSCLSSSSLISRASWWPDLGCLFFFYDLGTQIDAFVANENRGSCDQFGDFMLALAAEGTVASTSLFRTGCFDHVADDRRQFAAQLVKRFTFGVDARQVAGFDKPDLGLVVVIDGQFYHGHFTGKSS